MKGGQRNLPGHGNDVLAGAGGSAAKVAYVMRCRATDLATAVLDSDVGLLMPKMEDGRLGAFFKCRMPVRRDIQM